MKTFCSYYNQSICSSCKLIEKPYASQLQQKQDKLTQLLADFSGFELLKPIASPEVEFRNKAKFSVTGTISSPVIGLLGEEDLDEGREILTCPLHHPLINEVATFLKEFISLARLAPYQIQTKTGELKGIIIYYSQSAQAMYVRFILRSKESLDRIKKFSPELHSRFPQIQCLSANIQPVPHAILEGEEEVILTDVDFIQHQLGEIKMTLHPQGFVQTNQFMAQILYNLATDWVKDLGPQKFLELFSGQGAFSFHIQKNVKQALGVEINKEAVDRANKTAKALNLSHLTFLARDAANVNVEVKNFKPDVLLVNPPRKGLGKAVEVVRDSGARYFLYSSCNCETLAQDLVKLKDKYKVVRAQILDMFPHTQHFETLVLLKSTDV